MGCRQECSGLSHVAEARHAVTAAETEVTGERSFSWHSRSLSAGRG